MFRTCIRQHELGLVFRRGNFDRVLGPGTYVLPGIWFGLETLEIVDVLATRFRHPLLDLLVAADGLRQRLVVVDLTESQRALVWRDGRLFDFVGSGRFAYWNAPARVTVEVFDVDQVRFEHPQLDAVLTRPEARSFLATVDVATHEQLLLRRGGEHIATLGPGRHAFWSRANAIGWQTVDRREQLADVSGQEILTADKVTLRLNLVVAWKVTDPVAATTAVDDAAAAVYREAQLALRAAVGGRDLDRLLQDKDAVGNEVRTTLQRRTAGFGVAVAGVGIRDIVLPGDMKTILNQVIEARKRAEADLIRRREETAAARSQANTARLLAENPVLLRLKELESLEAILKGSRTTFVFGHGDLGTQLKSLVAARDE